MVFYNQEQFPIRYRSGVFIAFHGSWNRAPYAQGGYNVVFQPLAGDRASGQCEIFADGFAGAVKSPAKAEHRPSGLAVNGVTRATEQLLAFLQTCGVPVAAVAPEWHGEPSHILPMETPCLRLRG